MANIFNEQIPVGVVVDMLDSVSRDRAQHAVLVRPPNQEEDDIAAAVGQWVIDKYRAAAKERGYQAVAKQLRKQGVPIEIAKLILLEVQP